MENFSELPDLNTPDESSKTEAPKTEPPKVAPVEVVKPEPVKEIHHHHYETKRSGFSFARFLFGGLLILIGLAYLGNSLGWFEVNLDLWNFWPLLIVILGLSILSRHGWISWIVGAFITLAVLGGVGYVVFVGSPVEHVLTSDTIIIAKETTAELARVNINTGAGKLTLRGGSANLVNGSFESNITTLSKTSTFTGTTQTIGFDMQGGRWGGVGPINTLDLQLNSLLPNEVSIDSGAMDMQLDMSDINLTKLNIDTGASNLDLDLGDKADFSEVQVKAGASSLNISLPRTVGVRLDVKAGLTSKDLDDFISLGNGIYESEEYLSAVKKVSISLDLGVSSLEVKWR